MSETQGAPGTVLHVLAQRPGFTGSGTTLRALVREALARVGRSRGY